MLNAAATASPSLPVAIAEVVSHRPYLVRFALRKLRDPALAEDAVHDVIEAVLSGRARFGGRAALRSWLTAILKHKIVDVLRRAAISSGPARSHAISRPGCSPGSSGCRRRCATRW